MYNHINYINLQFKFITGNIYFLYIYISIYSVYIVLYTQRELLTEECTL